MLLYTMTACERCSESVTNKVIIYMAAQNNLSSFATEDFEEIRSAISTIPDNAIVLVYLHKSHREAELYRLCKHKCTLEATYPIEESSCDSAIFCSRIQEIDTQWPTEHTGLVLWSHGTGWTPPTTGRKNSFGRDDEHNALQLSIFAIQQACNQLNKPLDYIFFDACHMQSIEVAYQLRRCTRYILATPAEMPGAGAPYDLIMSDLCKGDMQAIGQTIYQTYDNPDDGIVLSLIETSQLEKLAEQVKDIVITYFGDRQTPDLGYPYLYTQQYSAYELPTGFMPDFYDLTSVLHRIQGTEQTITPDLVAKQIWMTEKWYSATMTGYRKVIDPKHSCGVSAFFPMAHYRANYLEYFHLFDWYQAAGWSETGW